jgi:putative transposase
VTFHDQVNQLPHMRVDVPALERFGTRVAIGTLIRLDEAFAAFFRRVSAGERPGYPRFRGTGRWASVQWSNTTTWDLLRTGKGTYGRLRIMGVGQVAVRVHRWFDEAEPRKLVVRRRGSRWEATVFWRGVSNTALPTTGRSAGVDVGVTILAAVVDDTGEVEFVHNPRALSRALARIERAQQAVAACSKTGRHDGKGRRAKAKARVARLHKAARNKRHNHAHQVSAGLVRKYDVIALEDLRIANMTRSARGTLESPGTHVTAKAGLNRSILDAGWGQLVRMISYKAEGAGRTVMRVKAPHTSQTCAQCGRSDPASRVSRDRFICTGCGHAAHADANAAEVVLAVAQGQLVIRAPRRRRQPSAKPGSGDPPARSGRDEAYQAADREVCESQWDSHTGPIPPVRAR